MIILLLHYFYSICKRGRQYFANRCWSVNNERWKLWCARGSNGWPLLRFCVNFMHEFVFSMGSPAKIFFCYEHEKWIEILLAKRILRRNNTKNRWSLMFKPLIEHGNERIFRCSMEEFSQFVHDAVETSKHACIIMIKILYYIYLHILVW